MVMAPWFVEWLTRYIGLLFVSLFLFQVFLQTQNKSSLKNKFKKIGKAFGFMLVLWAPFLFSSTPYIKDSFEDGHDPEFVSWYHHTSAYQKYNVAVFWDTLGWAEIAFFWYEFASNQGLIPANYRVCEMYETGDGVEASEDKAFLCFNALKVMQPVFRDDEASLYEAGDKAAELAN